MMGFDGSPAVTLLALALAATFVLLKVRASRIRDAMERRLPHAGAAYSALFYALAILCVPVGFFLMEFPYNERLFAMDGAYVGAGMVLTAALLAFFFFAGQIRLPRGCVEQLGLLPRPRHAAMLLAARPAAFPASP
ncbi:MAG: hypothetical protein U0L71_06360 [Eggerthellaceae bacterium]|nr:hypothetical protein [Eggerthellaceae bacterium]